MWKNTQCTKTFLKSIKKGNFWRLVDVPKPASVLVTMVFLFSVFFLISRRFLYQWGQTNTGIVFSGKKYIAYIFLGIFWGSQASEMTNLTFLFVNHFFRAKLLKQPSRGEEGLRGPKFFNISHFGHMSTCAKFEPNLKGSGSAICSLDVECSQACL